MDLKLGLTEMLLDPASLSLIQYIQQCLQDMQNLILTLWKVQFHSPDDYQDTPLLLCNLRYSGETLQSRPTTLESSLWKQTFVFKSETRSTRLDMELMAGRNTQQQDITATNSTYVGKSICVIKWDCEDRTPTLKKVDIINHSGRIVGTVEVSYQIHNPEAKCEDEGEYKFLVTISEIEISFKRSLQEKSFIYLKTFYGQHSKQQTIPLELEGEKLRYAYPIRYPIEEEDSLNFQLVTDKNTQTCNLFEMLSRNNQEVKEQVFKPQTKKRILNISNTIVYSVFPLDLGDESEGVSTLKLCVPPSIEVGRIKFRFSITQRRATKLSSMVFTQKQGVNKKPIKLVKNATLLVEKVTITLNVLSFNHQQLMVEVKFGDQIVKRFAKADVNEVVIGDSIQFKRIWEETLEVAVFESENHEAVRWLFSGNINLRDTLESRKGQQKEFKLLDNEDRPSGKVKLDLRYQDQEFFSKRLREKEEEDQLVFGSKFKGTKGKLAREVAQSLNRNLSRKSSNKSSHANSLSTSRSNELPPLFLLRQDSKQSQSPKQPKSPMAPKQPSSKSKYREEETTRINQSLDAGQKGLLSYRERVELVKRKVKHQLPPIENYM